MDRELYENENIMEEDEFEMIPMNPMWYNPMFMNMRSNMMGIMPMDNDYMSMMSMLPIMPMMDNEFERENDFNEEDFYNDDMNYEENMESNDSEMEYEDEVNFRTEKKYFDDNYDDKNYNQGNMSKADIIVRRIEKNNPGIFNTMKSYGIPYPVAKRLVRRIVVITLNYC